LEEEESNNKKLDFVSVETPNKQSSLEIKARPLPEAVTRLLEENSSLIQALADLENKKKGAQKNKMNSAVVISDDVIAQLSDFRQKLLEEFEAQGRKWRDVVDKIWSFGPRNCGPNILVNQIEDYQRPSIWSCLSAEAGGEGDSSSSCAFSSFYEYDKSIISGFQTATSAGPLCQEPLHGVCFVISKWTFKEASTSPVSSVDGGDDNGVNEAAENFDLYGPVSGQLISTSSKGFTQAFQKRSQRIMTAMYNCKIQTDFEVLGKVYAVIHQRHGDVIDDEMQQEAVGCSNMYTVNANIPVVESFGFVDDLRKQTCGYANPQLTFSHWQVVPFDPFWKPTTEEEIGHYGEKADFENKAAKYVNSVRNRKGLFVQKTVEHAEKQRTITRNK